ncbi:MAG TPA: hypothetical protein ENK06_12815 [Gammaproteobacteria bacterium]|nr:hypothetical protein [Gammaproteobacteria bacterium]
MKIIRSTCFVLFSLFSLLSAGSANADSPYDGIWEDSTGGYAQITTKQGFMIVTMLNTIPQDFGRLSYETYLAAYVNDSSFLTFNLVLGPTDTSASFLAHFIDTSTIDFTVTSCASSNVFNLCTTAVGDTLTIHRLL